MATQSNYTILVDAQIQNLQNIQKQLNPIGDIPTLPFSSERKVYSDEVWKIIEQYI
mgnify:CR=1 FL=1